MGKKNIEIKIDIKPKVKNPGFRKATQVHEDKRLKNKYGEIIVNISKTDKEYAEFIHQRYKIGEK